MPLQLDFVQRDGRLVAEREVRAELECPLEPLEEILDGYSEYERRQQLVDALYSAAKRTNARWHALRKMPFLRPLAGAAPSVRRAQLALSAGLSILVSLGVAPHTGGCGIACWAAEALGVLYAAFAALLAIDGGLEYEDFFAIFRPSAWLEILSGAPSPLLRQLALLGLAIGSLLVHPYFFLLTALDLLPAVPRCRALLRPLAKATPSVLAIAALAAALALPAAAAARAAHAVGECAAGDAAACAVQALAIIAPATASPRPAGTGGVSTGRAETGAGGAGTAIAEPAPASSSASKEAEPASALGGATLAQLGPLALLAMGALLLQLGVAVLVDALSDQRSRALVAKEYAGEHCLVCGASRQALERLGVRGFELHVRKTHSPAAYARLLADALRRTPSQRTDADSWLIECAERSDPSFLPSAGREYWEGPAALGSLAALGSAASGAHGHGINTMGWRPAGWEPGSEAAFGWKLSPEPTNAQLRAAIEQLAAEGARCAADVRKLNRGGNSGSGAYGAADSAALPPSASSHALAKAPPSGEGRPADWDAWAERLAALERASVLQAEQTGHATREASRVASELHHRFAAAHDTASAVADLTRLVTASSATVDRVMDDVDALRTAMGIQAPAQRPRESTGVQKSSTEFHA